MSLNNLLKLKPYELNRKNKKKLFEKQITMLTKFHYNNCKPYRKILNNLDFKIKNKNNIESFPMIPTQMFKKFDLKSVSSNEVIKKLVSSGTSTQKKSKVYLDKTNAKNQIKVLGKIMQAILGEKRLPMLIIDQDPKLSSRSTFNARAAAIYGFSIFGKNHCYILNKNNEINYDLLNIFLNKYSHGKFFIFGFTSYVYKNLINKLSVNLINSTFENGILLHGGGWKKMEEYKITNILFKKKLFDKIKLKDIFNYYGLVEQTGSIFIECKCGYFVTSIFSDVIIRDKKFDIVKNGNKGLIQLLSLLPTSYPGHNILTDDIGEIVKEDQCKCGLKGKFFLVHGRSKEAEIRGCSDAR